MGGQAVADAVLDYDKGKSSKLCRIPVSGRIATPLSPLLHHCMTTLETVLQK